MNDSFTGHFYFISIKILFVFLLFTWIFPLYLSALYIWLLAVTCDIHEADDTY